MSDVAVRRCKRCLKEKPVDEFPPDEPGKRSPRPFCIPCTDYILWATS